MERIMTDIKLLIFDLDGTIIDSEEANYKAYKNALAEVDVELSKDFFIKNCFNGQHYKDFLPLLMPNASDEEIEKVHDRKQEIYISNMKNISVNPIIKDIIIEFKNKKKLALATTAGAIAVQNVLRTIQLENAFDLILTGNDVKNKKPNPEVFIKCLEHFNIEPYQTVIFEDSDIGLEAANKTGAWIIKVEKWSNSIIN
ncbi:HAD family hydrolase [Brachyspira innocens]|uniref:HAD family hydrolase n=1 Tax=Brachyspira innocens TaxID=13264 RepID=UPI001FE01BE3|nr:HAD family phosphatase [Brachyspira innocens]